MRMSLSKKGSSTRVSMQIPKNNGTCLNPNAAEFFPFYLRASPAGTSSNLDPMAKFPGSGSLGKQVLDWSESSISASSDEEARQYWQRQLPDDITPDFKVMGEEDPASVRTLSLADLSLGEDTGEANRYMLNEQGEIVTDAWGFAFGNKLRYLLPSFGEDDLSAASILHLSTKTWEKQVASGEHFVKNDRDSSLLMENRRHGYTSSMISDNALMENNDMNPIEFLSSQFPGFAIESLAEVYVASGCDLLMTMDILIQFELQVGEGGSFDQTLNSTTLSAPNLSSMEFSALSVSHNMSSLPNFAGEEVPQAFSPYRSDNESMLSFKSSNSLLPSNSGGPVDFASEVRRLASQDSGMWRYESSMVADSSIGSSRNSPVFAGSCSSGAARGDYGDRLHSHGSGRSLAPSVWLEPGEATLYSELWENACDHACQRNACFEQARLAYLLESKALANKLGAKRQMHNVQMKAAHNKVQESMYQQRNLSGHEILGNGSRGGRGRQQQERLIDLHGLHASEAIDLLRNELAALRSATPTARIQVVYICVGMGHRTKGSCIPAGLPVAVQRYLLEEGLDYSEPQPGLLRVLLYWGT